MSVTSQSSLGNFGHFNKIVNMPGNEMSATTESRSKPCENTTISDVFARRASMSTSN